MGHPYQRFADLFETTPDDPKIQQLIDKIVAKGYRPADWLNFAEGHGKEPQKQTLAPIDTRGIQATVKPEPIEVAEPSGMQQLSADVTSFLTDPQARSEMLAEAPRGVRDPSARHELERGLSDTITLGLVERAARATGDTAWSPEQAEIDARRANTLRNAGRIVGMFSPGASRAGAGVASSLVGRAAGVGTGPISKVALGSVAGAAAMPATSAVLTAGQTALGPDGSIANIPRAAWEATKAAATDPLAMTIGGVFGGVGGVARAIRSSSGQTGKDLRLIEEHPEIYQVTAATRGTPENLGMVANTQQRLIRNALNERMKQAGKQMQIAKRSAAHIERPPAAPPTLLEPATITDIAPPTIVNEDFLQHPPMSTVPDSLMPTMLEARKPLTTARPQPMVVPETARPTITGSAHQPLDVGPIMDEALKVLASDRTTSSTSAVIERDILPRLRRANKEDNGTMRASDLADFKAKLMDLGKAKKLGNQVLEPEDVQLMGIAHAAGDILEQSPYAEINRSYAAAAAGSRRAHRLLGLGNVERTALENETVGGKLANALTRMGENTKTAGRERERLNQFVAENPDLKDFVMSPAILGARERLRFGMPEGSLLQAASGMVHKNVEPLLGRVIYPGGRALGRGAGFVGPLRNPVEAAWAEYQRRQEERTRAMSH